MAVYNGMHWLPEQVDSILKQENVSVSLWISVDSSQDGSEAWVDTLASHDARVHVLPHGQRFGHAARNFFRLLEAIETDAFDYISLADQDDIWFPDKLWRAHVRLVATGADAYSSNVLALWPDGRKKLIHKAQPQRRWDHFFEAAGPGCTYVFKSAVIADVQKRLVAVPSKMLAIGLHDWFLYAHVRAGGGTWVIDALPSMYYRQHENNQVGVNQGLRALSMRVRRVWSGWAMSQAHLIASLVDPDHRTDVPRWLKAHKMFRLALHASDCRRRFRDQILFFMSCLLSCVRR